VWEFEYSTCLFVVQHFWWAVHIWDGISIAWILGYITRPLWWIHWQQTWKPFLEKGFETSEILVEEVLERWGLLTKRKRQDTEQGGRKRM
jgi:hypothetical protein